MRISTRALLGLVALLLTSFALVACGDEGSNGGGGGGGTQDVGKLLDATFSGNKEVKSGKVDMGVSIDVQGTQSQSIEATLTGAFQSLADKKLPKFDFDLKFTGAGQSIAAGLATTGDRGFVNFNGVDYEVSQEIFTQFKTAYEQAAAQQTQQKSPSLATLGINPKGWLKNPRNSGTVKVGDTDTIKITGDVDVALLLDDVNKALSQAGKLGVQGTDQLPTELTAEQRKQIQDAVKSLKVEIYTGKKDTVLRRLLLDLTLVPPAGADAQGIKSAVIKLDIKLLDVNKPQKVSAPANPKPFDELAAQLGELGLGSLGGGGSDPSGGGGGGEASDKLQKYSECLTAAGSDLAEAQKCADLLK